MDEHTQEILEYLEKERQRGLEIHQEMEKLVLMGKATNEQADDWLYLRRVRRWDSGSHKQTS